MPSTTRGSILISTANDIGEALVEKLGGVGYSPNEWKEKYNLCGIAPVDSAPALSVLSDSAGTGDARGSILIATADAIGAILNKKYNVLRGFKPKEWASACRKMKALEEGSVASASIASFSDGADTVPLTSCVCSIDANLDGKTAVNAVHTRKNLFNVADYSQIYTDRDGVDSYNYRYMIIQLKPNTTYTISQNSGEYSGTPIILINNALPVGGANYFDLRKASDTKTYTTDSTGRLYIGSINSYDDVAYARLQVCKVQIEVGSSASIFEPYQTPETKTADLGRAVYGGSADIIKGEGKETHQEIDLGSLTWVYASASNRFYANLHLVGIYTNFPTNTNEIADITCADYETITFSSLSGDTSLNNKVAGVTTDASFITIRDTRFSNANDFKNAVTGKKAVIPLSTQTDFTFEPVKIDSFPGVNNIWNDSGNTAVEYYQAPTPYTRKTATGGVANFSDQRTDLPLTKAIANIAPSIAGKSAVNLYQGKKNLFDNTGLFPVSGSVSSYYFKQFDVSSGLIPEIHLKEGVTYTFAVDVTSTIEPFNLSVGCGNGVYSTDILTVYNKNSGRVTITFTPTAAQLSNGDVLAFRCPRYGAQNTFDYSISNAQLEVGSSASDYEPYQTPTTYTAELGETVYGGSVDFVSGEVKQVVKKKTVSSFSGTYGAVNNGYAYYITDADTTHMVSAVNPTMMIANQLFTYGNSTRVNAPTWQYGGNDGNNQTHTFILPSEYDTLAKANDFLANLETPLEVTLTLTTPTESEIPGRVISPIEGVNNYWNDAGGDTEIQYFENEA